jgi:uncharacterized protein
MRLLIDGYNLMFESFESRQNMEGKHALRQARERLMQTVLDLIDPEERPETMIVFDAKDAPNHLPDQTERAGIQIVFARDWDSADELIQNEIRKHSAPKQLTVVSSDHAIHKKAKARGATVMDCSQWLDRQWNDRARRQRQEQGEADAQTESNEERQRKLSQEEKQNWLKEFGY